VWHASVAVLSEDGRPIPTGAWSPKRYARAVRVGHRLLEGRGAGETFVKLGQAVVHVRRSLSPEEIAGLDPAWVALPAIDIAG